MQAIQAQLAAGEPVTEEVLLPDDLVPKITADDLPTLVRYVLFAWDPSVSFHLCKANLVVVHLSDKRISYKSLDQFQWDISKS